MKDFTQVKAVHTIVLNNETLKRIGRKPGEYIQPGETFPCPDDQLADFFRRGAIASTKTTVPSEAEETAPERDASASTGSAAEDALENKPITELRKIGKGLGLTFPRSTKAAEMVAKIELARQADEEDPGDDLDDMM